MMQSVYEQENISTEWKYSLIVPIDKEEWDIQDCGDGRGIELLYFEDLWKDYWEKA